jgi:arylsulfatase A-like enzyme
VGHRFWVFQKELEYIEARMQASDFDPAHAAKLQKIFGNVVGNYYAYIDRLVGELVEAAGAETLVMIVSDHGFQDMVKADMRTAATFSGGHKIDGVIIMSGPGITRGAKIEGAAVADITPTLLHLFGMPVGADMTGAVITGPLSPDFAENNPVRSIVSYETRVFGEERAPIEAPGIDAALVENLKALGYVSDTDEYTPSEADPVDPKMTPEPTEAVD